MMEAPREGQQSHEPETPSDRPRSDEQLGAKPQTRESAGGDPFTRATENKGSSNQAPATARTAGITVPAAHDTQHYVPDNSPTSANNNDQNDNGTSRRTVVGRADADGHQSMQRDAEHFVEDGGDDTSVDGDGDAAPKTLRKMQGSTPESRCLTW